MKTAELTGADLDAWVAKADGRAFDIVRLAPQGIDFVTVVDTEQSGWVAWSPSRLWQDGGPIMERDGITPFQDRNWYEGAVGTPRYLACKDLHAEEGRYWSTLTGSDPAELAGDFMQSGDTYLQAGMRCFVASKLGEDVSE